jgi:hypothetical protein
VPNSLNVVPLVLFLVHPVPSTLELNGRLGIGLCITDLVGDL